MSVLFDLDGTILGARRDKFKVRKECSEKVGAPIIQNEKYYDALRKIFHNREIDTRLPVFKYIFHDEELAEEFAKEYSEKSLENAYLYPDAKEVLRKMSMKKGLVTNGPRLVQWEKIRKFDLERFFDFIAVSGEIGMSKPEEHIFRYVLDSLGSEAEDSFYVGNVPELDVEGAKNAGLTSILINRSGGSVACEPDYEIEDLREIFEIVDSSSDP